MQATCLQQSLNMFMEDWFEYGMDLWVGGLTEEHLNVANLGPTYACLMAMTFSN